LVDITDHKNGKVSTDNFFPQLELYAIGGFLTYQQATTVRTQIWYLKHGVIVPDRTVKENADKGIYTRPELPKLIKVWETRAAPMLHDTSFVPRPGRYCGWCAYSKAKGGPCKY
jgi:hypothetical protein